MLASIDWPNWLNKERSPHAQRKIVSARPSFDVPFFVPYLPSSWSRQIASSYYSYLNIRWTASKAGLFYLYFLPSHTLKLKCYISYNFDISIWKLVKPWMHLTNHLKADMEKERLLDWRSSISIYLYIFWLTIWV